MITVGLVKQLLYLHQNLKSTIYCSLGCDHFKNKLDIRIQDNYLEIDYLSMRIWHENLDETISLFGPESCQNIFNIMKLIDSGDNENWPKLIYIEKDS